MQPSENQPTGRIIAQQQKARFSQRISVPGLILLSLGILLFVVGLIFNTTTQGDPVSHFGGIVIDIIIFGLSIALGITGLLFLLTHLVLPRRYRAPLATPMPTVNQDQAMVRPQYVHATGLGLFLVGSLFALVGRWFLSSSSGSEGEGYEAVGGFFGWLALFVPGLVLTTIGAALMAAKALTTSWRTSKVLFWKILVVMILFALCLLVFFPYISGIGKR